LIDKSAYLNCTREITEDDSQSVFDLLNSKKSISKVKFDQTPEIVASNIKKSIKDPYERIIGYFENGILISYLVQRFGQRVPAWHMTLLATRSQHRWNYKSNGLEYCWSNAMDFAEEQGIYRIYWSLPISWARAQKKTISTTDVWNRYNIYVEDIIPPMQFPKFEEFKGSFGLVPKPHETVIKQAILKNEYRRFNQKI
jgi:hypothetical protein